ncbi:PEGA domain-containing protein [Halioglobus maricola]|uniref:PEGA domain-containing protein n=2 Tax=Halioglobus maricola TaxID=2601894 RepID=A0A5P9NPY5_9GAMM|nr:PEGA domain-containing protein [Halioglobus maricola]
MAFVLSSRSLDITVEAETDAEVDVSGLAIPFGDRYLLRPGQYEVSATAPGYHPLTTEVTVGDADNQRTTLVLAPLPGLLSIDSSPAGAELLLDGESIGKTPLLELPVEAGVHQLEITSPRYFAQSREIEITGRNQAQQLSFALLPAWASYSIDSVPQGADILIDGEVVGQTPATVELLQGERQLQLSRAAYTTWDTALTVTAGMDDTLGTIELEPAAGILSLNSDPAGANVTMDGEFQGQTPLQLTIEPGLKHRIALSKPGYDRRSETIELAAAQTEERTVVLKARKGDVKFRISPASAELRVNGRAMGKGSRTLELPAIAHRIEVSLPGYASQIQTVTPRPGLLQQVSITLQTENEARLARNKPELETALGQTLVLFNPQESGMADFSMGASRREAGRRANEVMHPVSLRRMFYLQTTEVTNAQFRAYQADHKSGQIEGNSLNRNDQPAVALSWQQAASFCNWLSKREGLPAFYRENQGVITGFNPSSTGYRLPTEAEWAWAARTFNGSLLKFPWGSAFPPPATAENYADNTSAYVTGRILNGYKDGHVVSAPVGSYQPNHRGLYDMGGNVAEWVHDVYTIPSADGTTVTDPLGAQTGDNYVIRGASWSHSRIGELRLSYRDYGAGGRDDVGFRVARYADE